HVAVASNMAGKSGLQQLQLLLARLFVLGADLDLAPLFRHRSVSTSVLDVAAERAAPRKRTPQMIETLNPRLRLDDAFAARLRASLAATEGSAVTKAVEPAAHRPNGSTPVAVAPATATKVPSVDLRLNAVHAHFDLMRSFLDSQARVMTQFGMGAQPAQPSDLSAPWMQAETGRICRRL